MVSKSTLKFVNNFLLLLWEYVSCFLPIILERSAICSLLSSRSTWTDGGSSQQELLYINNSFQSANLISWDWLSDHSQCVNQSLGPSILSAMTSFILFVDISNIPLYVCFPLTNHSLCWWTFRWLPYITFQIVLQWDLLGVHVHFWSGFSGCLGMRITGYVVILFV